MRASKVLRDVCVSEVARLRALLRDGKADPNPDPETFYLLFQKHHAQLSPPETVQAAALFRRFHKSVDAKSRQGSTNIHDVRATLSSDIRGKLYALTDPVELCDVVTGIAKHDIACKALIADFTGRLERLFSSVKGEILSHVADCIVILHQRGHRVVPLCSKLFAHLASRGAKADFTLKNYVALVRCMDVLSLRHEALGTTIGRGLRRVLSSGVHASQDDITILLQSYKDDMCDSRYIRHCLIDLALGMDESVPLPVIAHCLNVGVFPSKSIDKIDSIVLTSALSSTSTCINTKLSIFRGYGSLRYKPMDVINPLLRTIREDASSLTTFNAVAQYVHGLFVLDLKDDTALQHAADLVQDNKVTFSTKDIEDICNLLIAFCHFGVRDTAAYERLFMELLRLCCSLKDADTVKLQIVAIYIWKCMDSVFEGISSSVKSFLAEVLTKGSPVPMVLNSSALQDEVGKTATFISYTHYKEVLLGPFLVDFVRPLGDDEIGEMRQRDNRFQRTRHMSDERQLSAQLRDCAHILFTDDKDQFYRNTRDRTAESQVNLAVLRGLGYSCVNVPYWEWQALSGWREKRSYLQDLFEKRCATNNSNSVDNDYTTHTQ